MQVLSDLEGEGGGERDFTLKKKPYILSDSLSQEWMQEVGILP